MTQLEALAMALASRSIKLTPAELRAVSLAALGHNDREIAGKLGLKVGSVKVVFSRVYRNLGISHTWGNPRVRLVLWWLEQQRAAG